MVPSLGQATQMIIANSYVTWPSPGENLKLLKVLSKEEQPPNILEDLMVITALQAFIRKPPIVGSDIYNQNNRSRALALNSSELSNLKVRRLKVLPNEGFTTSK